jgi:7-carboxy-7-deazaguanine synthase
MFGKNKIYVPKSYKDEPAGTLKVTSRFGPTLQGEGPFSGRTAIFVRLMGCNIQCQFCDTFFDAGDTMTFDEVFNSAEKLWNDFYASVGTQTNVAKPLMVITGGEPMNQPNLSEFLKHPRAKDWDIQFESNGLIEREIQPENYLIISPKANEKTKQFIKLNSVMLDRADCLKFVISKTEEGYQDLPQFALDWRAKKRAEGKDARIYVSPMNMYNTQPIKIGPDGDIIARSETDERISFWTPGLLDLKANQENHEHAAFIAMKHQAYLSLQTHLYASLP